MMGQLGGSQDRLFYSFNLDDHVPSNHLLRGIDRFFDLTELRTHLAPFYSHTGRPSNRHGRFRESDTFRHVFESVLRRCMTEGLVRGEGFAIDASVIKADANRARGVPGSETTDWRKEAATSRAVREYLDALEHVNPTSDDDAEPPQPPAPGKNVSLTDPAARWTAAPGGPAF